MRKFAGIVLSCVLLLQSMGMIASAEEAQNARVIYVSAENGSDSGRGTESSPFLTVKRAQEEARLYGKDMQSDIVVELAGGTYFQEETLRFDERDSGSNGYRVTYRAKEGEEAVISGGKKVENWEKRENGVWVARVDDPEIIREFYVNGQKQTLARTNTKIPGQGYYVDPNEPGVQKGILLDKSLLDGIEHPEDMVFRWSSAWMCYALMCEGIVNVNADQSAAILQADFKNLSSRETNPIRAIAGMVIENALKFMDQPSEFYYDRHEKLLYYIPQEGVDMNQVEAVVPVLEKVAEIGGSDSAHILSGIDFKDLTFSHGTWFLPAQYGYNPVQAQWIYIADFEIEFTPSNISVSFADDIGFYGNTFTGLGCVGLGLNEMVSNAKIVGNSFYDIKDSAISVGLLTHEYIAEPEGYLDVARKKPTTASSFISHKYRPEQAVNPISTEVGWQAQSGDGAPWLQIDLEDKFAINEVSLLFEYGGMDGGKVLLSNDENFETFTTLVLKESKSQDCKNSFAISEMVGKKYSYSADSAKKYRYARIYVQPGSKLIEAKVYDSEQAGIALEGVCNNNLISDNYITRCSDYFWSSPGITAYYVDHLQILNNHLEDLPYTGISLGWGWIFNTDSTTCHDNLVKGNFIKNIMLECYDGGGIYTLGQQPGTVVEENYIRYCHFNYGALYLDGGSVDITVRNNVVEDTIAYFMNSPADGSNDVYHNYVTTTRTTVQNPDTKVSDPVPFPIDMPTAEIQKVMVNSGLRAPYRYLIERTPEKPDYYNGFGKEGYINVTDTSGSGGIMTSLMNDEVIAANIALEQAKVGNGFWEFPEEALETFRSAMYRARGKMNETESDTAAKAYEEWQALRSAYQNFLESRNKVSYDELLSLCKNALALAQSGEGRSQYPQEAIDAFARFLSEDISYVKNNNPYLHLEQAYLAFLEQRQNLAITGVEMNNMIGEPVIDNVRSTVTITVDTSTDLSMMAVKFLLSDGCKLSDQTANVTDFSSPITLVVKNENETAYRFWTVSFRKTAISSFGT